MTSEHKRTYMRNYMREWVERPGNLGKRAHYSRECYRRAMRVPGAREQRLAYQRERYHRVKMEMSNERGNAQT